MRNVLITGTSSGFGLHTAAEVARRMTREAGFTRFEPLDLGHPVNAFYVVRR